MEHDITLLEGAGYEITLTVLTADSVPATTEEHDVYGALESCGARMSFSVSPTGEAGQWLVIIPAVNIASAMALPYQIFVRRRATGHEWLVLSGTVRLRHRYASAGDALATPPLRTSATLSADSAALTVTELHGVRGEQGFSTYDIACRHGFEGSEAEWLASLKAEYAAEAVAAVTPLATAAQTAAETAADAQKSALASADAAAAAAMTSSQHMSDAETSAQTATAAATTAEAAAAAAASSAERAHEEFTSAASEASAAREAASVTLEAKTEAVNAASTASQAATAADGAQSAAQAAQAEAEAQALAAATSAAALSTPFADCTSWAELKRILPTINKLSSLSLTLPKMKGTNAGEIYNKELDLFLTLPQSDLGSRGLLQNICVKNIIVYIPNSVKNVGCLMKHHKVVQSAAIIAPKAASMEDQLFRWDGIPIETKQGIELSAYLPEARECTALFWSQSKAGRMTLYAPKCTKINMLCSPMLYNAYAENPSIAFTLGNVTHAERAFSACKKIHDEQFPTSWQYLKYGKGMFELCELGKEVSIAILSSLQTATTETGTNIWNITMGIHVDHQTDEELIAAILAAEEKGWIVTVQWNGTATSAAASTFARRQPVFARLGETLEDGTPSLDWGHYVTNAEEHGYTEFASLEEAKEHFNIKDDEQ